MLQKLPLHQQPGEDNKHGYNKQQQAQPVNAMHVFHPLRTRLVWVRLAQVQVFGYLAKNVHKKTVSKDTVNLKKSS
jgi:hypothetical protein